jgi:hypothetical protein
MSWRKKLWRFYFKFFRERENEKKYFGLKNLWGFGFPFQKCAKNFPSSTTS